MRATKREERKGLVPRGVLRHAHEVRRLEEAVRRGLEVVQQRLALPTHQPDNVQRLASTVLGSKGRLFYFGEPDVALEAGVGRDCRQPLVVLPQLLEGAHRLQNRTRAHDNKAARPKVFKVGQKVLDGDRWGACDGGASAAC